MDNEYKVKCCQWAGVCGEALTKSAHNRPEELMISKKDPPSAAEDCAESRSKSAAADLGARVGAHVGAHVGARAIANGNRIKAGYFNLSCSIDLLFAAISVLAALAVLHSFVIGRHYIIPSLILVVAVVLGNIAWYGLQGHRWAKILMFWSALLFTCHAFFALFWSKAYREVLGSAFEWVCGVTVILFVYLLLQYVRQNQLFGFGSGRATLIKTT
jgi:hypothetical protein